MSKTLDEIRMEIDSIDNQIHDLLMDRAALVSSIAAEKKKKNMQIVQPAREARMMRRLLARHKGPLPKETIIRIWRELVGSVQVLQSGYKVSVVANDRTDAYWTIATEYFGSAVPVVKALTPRDAIQLVNCGEVDFAVLPWSVSDRGDWWTDLVEKDGKVQDISVIGALPYDQYIPRDAAIENKHALVVSKVKFMSSDKDVSFIGGVLRDGNGIEDVLDMLAEQGVVIKSHHINHDAGDTKFLIEVDGFYDGNSEECNKINSLLDELCLYYTYIGGYPVV